MDAFLNDLFTCYIFILPYHYLTSASGELTSLCPAVRAECQSCRGSQHHRCDPVFILHFSKISQIDLYQQSLMYNLHFLLLQVCMCLTFHFPSNVVCLL